MGKKKTPTFRAKTFPAWLHFVTLRCSNYFLNVRTLRLDDDAVQNVNVQTVSAIRAVHKERLYTLEQACELSA